MISTQCFEQIGEMHVCKWRPQNAFKTSTCFYTWIKKSKHNHLNTDILLRKFWGQTGRMTNFAIFYRRFRLSQKETFVTGFEQFSIGVANLLSKVSSDLHKTVWLGENYRLSSKTSETHSRRLQRSVCLFTSFFTCFSYELSDKKYAI